MKYTFTEKELATSAAPQPPALPRRNRPAPRKGGAGKWILALLALAVAAFVAYRLLNKGGGGTVIAGANATTSKAVSGNEEVTAETVAQIKAYLTPSEAEVEQLYSYVINSPFVAENLQYRNRLSGLPFHYYPASNVVNAAAERYLVEKDQKKSIGFRTVFLGGAAHYSRLVGLAAALQEAGEKDILQNFVNAMPKRFCVRCTEDDCVKFIVANGLARAVTDEKIRLRAVSFSSGAIVSILAHECGHHAFGHLLGFPEKQNLEIDRNQEREADSFASSVISASPFGEYVFAGTLLWHYALAVQADGDSDLASTHPLSKDRFKDFLKQNAAKTAAMGITLK